MKFWQNIHTESGSGRVEIFAEMDHMKDEDLEYFGPTSLAPRISVLSQDARPEPLRNYCGHGSARVIKGYQTNEIPQYGAIRG